MSWEGPPGATGGRSRKPVVYRTPEAAQATKSEDFHDLFEPLKPNGVTDTRIVFGEILNSLSLLASGSWSSKMTSHDSIKVCSESLWLIGSRTTLLVPIAK